MTQQLSHCNKIQSSSQFTIFQNKRLESVFKNIPAMYFNSCSRIGSDPLVQEKIEMQRNFNPRSRIGSDDYNYDVDGSYKQFQSTPPYRERLHPQSITEAAALFQSTPPYRKRLQFLLIFILLFCQYAQIP